VDLEIQTLDAEQQKLALGASTPYNVILIQRDLATAQLALVSAARLTRSRASCWIPRLACSSRATGSRLKKPERARVQGSGQDSGQASGGQRLSGHAQFQRARTAVAFVRSRLKPDSPSRPSEDFFNGTGRALRPCRKVVNCRVDVLQLCEHSGRISAARLRRRSATRSRHKNTGEN